MHRDAAFFPLGIIGLIGSLRVLPRGTGIPGTRLDPGGVVIVTAPALAPKFKV